MPKKKFGLICFIFIASSLLLAGCFHSGVIKDDGDLTLQIDLPDHLRPQYTNYEFFINQIFVTVSQDDQKIVQTIDPTIIPNTQPISTTFSNLLTGTWNIEVIAKDEAGYSVYSTTSTANVTSDNTTTVALELEYTPGQLNIEVPLPQELQIASGRITLTDPTDQTQQLVRNLTIGASSATATFSDLKARIWTLEVETFDVSGHPIRSGHSSINILPGHTENLQISVLASGTLQLNFDLVTPPSKPTGLKATPSYSSATVSWERNPETNIDGYILYASDSETGRKVPIEFTPNTSYYDDSGSGKAEIWYWVQAIDYNGYSSELSDPIRFINYNNIDYKLSFMMSDSNQSYICTVNYDGSQYRELLTGNQYFSPFVSPDGRYIAVAESNTYATIHLIHTDDSGVTTLPTSYFDMIQPAGISWSPDSSKFVFTDHIADTSTNCLNLNIYDLNRDLVYMLTDYTTTALHPLEGSWSPEGSTIAYALYNSNEFYGNPTYLFTINATTGTDLHRLSDLDGVFNISWSPDGSKLAFVDRESSSVRSLYTIQPDGTGQTKLYTGWVGDYAWSPDGSQIVYVYRTIYDSYNLAIVNTDGTENTPLNWDAAFITDVLWAPNGKIIIAQSGDVGYDIIQFNPDCSGVEVILDSSIDTFNPGMINSLSIFSTN